MLRLNNFWECLLDFWVEKWLVSKYFKKIKKQNKMFALFEN